MAKKKVGRPKLADKNMVKDHTITLRVNSIQDAYFEQVRKIVADQLKVDVTKTWVILNLAEYGRPAFEKKYGIKATKRAA